MEYKKINWAFLGFLGLEILLMAYLVFFGSNINLDDVLVSTLLAESTIVIPPIIVLALSKYQEGVFKRIGLNTIKPLTIVAVLIYGVLVMPVGTLANAISMLWVDNTVLESSGAMIEAPWYITLLSTAIVAPFLEEFAFRGFIYCGYRRDGSRLAAVFMSAIAFACMHLNFNQAAYALVVGVAFALIVEATGSLWSSIICHMMFNAESVIVMLIGNYLEPGMYDDVSVDRTEILDSLPGYIVGAFVATILAIMVLAWAAKLQGRLENVRLLFERRAEGEKRPRIISGPIVISFIMCIAYMIFDMVQ